MNAYIAFQELNAASPKFSTSDSELEETRMKNRYTNILSCKLSKRYRIPKGQSRETGSIGYIRRRNTKQKHNTICVGHRYMQVNKNNINKTGALLQTTGGKDKLSIVIMQKS